MWLWSVCPGSHDANSLLGFMLMYCHNTLKGALGRSTITAQGEAPGRNANIVVQVAIDMCSRSSVAGVPKRTRNQQQWRLYILFWSLYAGVVAEEQQGNKPDP